MIVWTILLNTFREAIRNKVLYSALVFMAALVAISAVFGSVSIGSQEKIIKDFGFFALSFFGAIAAVATGVNLLNKELKQKTIYNILSKPLERWQFVLGKQLGLILTTSVLVSLAGIGFAIFTTLFTGRFDPLIFEGLYFVLLELTIVASAVIFFSCIVITTTLTGLFTIALYVAGRSVSYLNYFTQSGEGPESIFLSRFIHFLDLVLPDLSLFNFGNTLVYGIAATPSQLYHATVYAFAYSAVLFVLSACIFRYREFN